MKQILYKCGALLATILLSSITELHALQDNKIEGTNYIQIANLEDIADDDMKNAEVITDTNQNVEISGDYQDSAEDEEDGNIQNQHMPGQEMQQSDILEFSADVLGDTPEENQDKEKVLQKPKNLQHKKVAAAKAKVVRPVKKQSRVSIVQLKKSAEKPAQVDDHLKKISEAKKQLVKEQEEIARIEAMEQLEEQKAKEEEKKQVEALLEFKQKKAKLAANRLKETKEKIAKLKQGQVQQAHLFVHVSEDSKKAQSHANVTNITFVSTNQTAVEQNLTVLTQEGKKAEVVDKKNSSFNTTRSQNLSTQSKAEMAFNSNKSTKINDIQSLQNNTQALSAKKSENTELENKIAQIKARTAELKAQTARQKAKILELHHHNETKNKATESNNTANQTTISKLTQSNQSGVLNVTANCTQSEKQTLNSTEKKTMGGNVSSNGANKTAKNERNDTARADLTNEITAKIDGLLAAKKMNATSPLSNNTKKDSVKKISLVKVSTQANASVSSNQTANVTQNVTSVSNKDLVKPESINKTSNSNQSMAQSNTKIKTLNLINVNKIKEQKKQQKVRNLIQSVIQKNKPKNKVEIKPKLVKALESSPEEQTHATGQGEDDTPEPTKEQILAVKNAMDLEKQVAIAEGLEQTEKETPEDEQALNERAAAEAAKDLVDDPTAEQESQEMAQREASRTETSAADIEKQETLGNLLRSNGLHNLAQSTSGLDSLIGASSALEMADGDPEYLKRYSEKIAMEADESDSKQKLHDHLVESARQKIKEKKEAEKANVLTVAKAREQAAILTAQMQAGVEQAERRKELADKQLEMIQKQAKLKQSNKRNRKIKSSGPLPNGFEI